MMKRVRSRAALALVVAGLAACTATTTAFAFFPPGQGRVVPDVQFGALVNGTSSNVTIRMGCFGAVRPGQSGHPMTGQTVEVFRPEVLQVPGFTGDSADEIVAHFTEDPSVPIVLRRFGRRAAIPTSLRLPCGGSGSVVFTPVPTSPTASSATIPVNYVGQP
jgi:hypothetical protein